MKSSFYTSLLIAVVGMAAAQDKPNRPVVPTDPPKDVLEVIAKDPELSLFADALRTAGLDETLRSPGPWTLFVPSNQAFRALPNGTMNNWSKPENQAAFQGVVAYHAVKGVVPAASNQAREVVTLQGSRLVVKKAAGMVWIGSAEVLRGDIPASNGVIHVINRVMEPDVQVAPAGPEPVKEDPVPAPDTPSPAPTTQPSVRP